MMNNAMCVYKDTSLSKEGSFQLADTVKNVVVVDGGEGSSAPDPVNP
jgi:hypothetical protein